MYSGYTRIYFTWKFHTEIYGHILSYTAKSHSCARIYRDGDMPKVYITRQKSYRKCYITSFNLLLQKWTSEQFHGKEGFYTASLRFSLFLDSIASDLFWIVVKQPRKLPKLISAISTVWGSTFCLKWSPRDFVGNFLQTPHIFPKKFFLCHVKWLLVPSHWHWVYTL
jgi:hypothetical protein